MINICNFIADNHKSLIFSVSGAFFNSRDDFSHHVDTGKWKYHSSGITSVNHSNTYNYTYTFAYLTTRRRQQYICFEDTKRYQNNSKRYSKILA